MKHLEWIDMMKYQNNIRLFCSLHIKKAKKGALSSALEIDAMFQIYLSTPPVTPLLLSQQMGTSKTIISRVIQSLCKKGLIEKQFGQADRRSYSVAITNDGMELLNQMCTYYLKPIYQLKDHLGETDFETLMSLIFKANQKMTVTQKGETI